MLCAHCAGVIRWCTFVQSKPARRSQGAKRVAGVGADEQRRACASVCAVHACMRVHNQKPWIYLCLCTVSPGSWRDGNVFYCITRRAITNAEIRARGNARFFEPLLALTVGFDGVHVSWSRWARAWPLHISIPVKVEPKANDKCNLCVNTRIKLAKYTGFDVLRSR